MRSGRPDTRSTSGLSDGAIEAVLHGRDADELTAEQRAAHHFTRELVQRKSVSSDNYRNAEAVLGRRGVVDLVHLIGLYLATSALLNAFDIPAPPG